MDIYKLNRVFWDFAFENTGKIKPAHIAIYQFAIEHCNRLGWKRNFGLPTSMVIDAIGIKSYSVFKAAFDDLVEFGFFDVLQYSKNQYSSNIIALKENRKANTKALDKALTKHSKSKAKSKEQSNDESNPQSSVESNMSIDKQVYNYTNLHGNISPDEKNDLVPLPAKMQSIFINKLKGKYVSAPAFDMPVILEILNFVFEQETGVKKSFCDYDENENEMILLEWDKWIDWYEKYGKQRSLDTLINKFKMMQEIYLQTKNDKNGNASSFGKTGTAKITGASAGLSIIAAVRKEFYS